MQAIAHVMTGEKLAPFPSAALVCTFAVGAFTSLWFVSVVVSSEVAGTGSGAGAGAGSEAGSVEGVDSVVARKEEHDFVSFNLKVTSSRASTYCSGAAAQPLPPRYRFRFTAGFRL